MLKLIDAAKADEMWRTTVGTSLSVPDRIVLAELARYGLLSLSLSSKTRVASVSQLLTYVRQRLQFIVPPQPVEKLEFLERRNRDLNLRIKDVLDDLESIGDATELSRGVWQVPRNRYVRLKNDVAVVSALPTEQLRKLLGVQFNSRTLLRTSDVSNISKLESVGFFEQSIATWLGHAVSNLDAVNSEFEALAASAWESEITDPFDVYAPWLKNSRQYFRWMSNEAIDQLPAGPYLCRGSVRKNRTIRYWIGNVVKRSSGFVAVSEYPVNSSFVSCLQFCLDKKYGAPNFYTKATSAGEVSLTFNLRLPSDTYRLVSALASNVAFNQDYSRTYSFHEDQVSDVLDRFAVLGISLGDR